ncbi:hypothetical protein BDB00DRAFT_775158 [Zychaea mexicana]|uniref:uncharacterized protein n=1 Tax=Zychaea mexicana TaxID=64656 RepID=UPI0022FE8D02|nr:uncharacterized protein BDB00DRAFT_775158 [Zychaea mexicana]KAI9484318.1 hypothetical protein BDB00DRAFT_775158 [Zychaea mexicana]
MLLGGQTYFETIENLLDSRTTAITDIVTKKQQQQQQQQQQLRLAYQLKEVIQIIHRTLTHVYEIFTKNQLVTNYVQELEKNFMSKSTAAITRVFSPSTNVHLLMRYLPESVQNYTPSLEAGELLLQRDVQQFAQSWLQNIEEQLQTHLQLLLQQIDNHAVLVDVRSRLWDFLDTDTTASHPSWSETCQGLLEQQYSVWESLLRDAFNARAKELIDIDAKTLSDQPRQVIWKRIESRGIKKCGNSKDCFFYALSSQSLDSTSIPLPHSSATKAIEKFKKALNDASQGRSSLIQEFQQAFDDILQTMRTDLEHHQQNTEKDQFYSKTDTSMIRSYFQDACFNSITAYTSGLKELLIDLKGWTDEKAANRMSIFVGLLARTIAISSKELPRALALTKSATLELKSGVNRDPKYKKLQDSLLDIFHNSHENWISTVAKEFSKSLSAGLARTKWNDECSAALVWAGKDT